jgi:hypothetical protein
VTCLHEAQHRAQHLREACTGGLGKLPLDPKKYVVSLNGLTLEKQEYDLYGFTGSWHCERQAPTKKHAKTSKKLTRQPERARAAWMRPSCLDFP